MLSALGYGRGDDPDRNIHFAGQSTTARYIPVHADAIVPLLGRLQSVFLSRILRRHRLLLNGMAEGPPHDFQDTVRLDQVKRVMKITSLNAAFPYPKTRLSFARSLEVLAR